MIADAIRSRLAVTGTAEALFGAESRFAGDCDVRRAVDVAHWASEHPWCAQAAAVVSAALGGTVDVHISYRRTDPRTIGLAQSAGRPPR